MGHTSTQYTSTHKYTQAVVHVVGVTPSVAMTEVRVHAAFTVKDEEEFLKEAQKMIDATQTEKGCIHYQLYREMGQQGSFAMVETWATKEDLLNHSKSGHVKSFQASQKENVSAVIQTFGPV